MKKILLDTDIIIDFLRSDNKKNTPFFEIATSGKYAICLSSTTITELWAGKSIAKKPIRDEVIDLITNCKIIYPNLEISKEAGSILRRTRYRISFQDACIGATAICHNLPIFTFNEKDFRKIVGIKLETF